MPVVTEFALRIAYVCGTLSPVQIQDFFGFTKKETDAIIQTLLNERLIKWNEDELLELTSYALTRFQDSSDHLPRFFKIQEWSSEVIFDLISFSPAGRPNRLKRVNSLVELAARNIERQSKTIQYAEQAFQEHFHSICKKNKAEIYKISAVDAGEHFSIPLPCMFYLDLDGQVNIRRDIDNEAFNNRLEISEAITDALSKQERPQNNSFMDFIHYFDYSLFERYVSNDAFDLRRYVQDVHLTRIVCYDNRRVTPLLGAFYLQHNADLIITRLGDEILKQEEMLVNKEAVSYTHLLLDSRNKKKSNPVGTYVMISGRNNAAKDRAFKYRDQFQYLFNLDICLMDGKLELLLIPGLIVCVLFHFHLEHQPVSIPIGFISSEVEHLKIASSLISESTRSKQIFTSMYDSENVPVAYQGLQNLLGIISTE